MRDKHAHFNMRELHALVEGPQLSSDESDYAYETPPESSAGELGSDSESDVPQEAFKSTDSDADYIFEDSSSSDLEGPSELNVEAEPVQPVPEGDQGAASAESDFFLPDDMNFDDTLAPTITGYFHEILQEVTKGPFDRPRKDKRDPTRDESYGQVRQAKCIRYSLYFPFAEIEPSISDKAYNKAQELYDELVVDPNSPPSKDELKWMACKLVCAVTRPVNLSFNIGEYSRKVPQSTRVPANDPNPPPMPESERESLRKFFVDCEYRHEDRPCVVLDQNGIIIVWYLPDIIHPKRTVAVNKAAVFLNDLFKKEGCDDLETGLPPGAKPSPSGAKGPPKRKSGSTTKKGSAGAAAAGRPNAQAGPSSKRKERADDEEYTETPSKPKKVKSATSKPTIAPVKSKGRKAKPKARGEDEAYQPSSADEGGLDSTKKEKGKKKGKPNNKAKPANWRKDSIFNRKTNLHLKSGAINFSPGWFSLGQTALDKKFRPSYLMREDAAEKWFRGIQFTEACINAIFAVISPDLYAVGVQSIEDIKKDGPTKHFPKAKSMSQKLWDIVLRSIHFYPSICTGMTIIANKLTPSHRDNHGRHENYDILYSAGEHTRANFKLPDINMSLGYKPNCIIALCGRTLRHQVMDYDGPDRLCIAHYMRPDVLSRLECKEPTWVSVGPILEHCAPQFLKENRNAWLLADHKRAARRS